MTGRKHWMQKARRMAVVGFATVWLAACGLTPEQDRAAIEKGILETPGAEELWRTIKAEYPQEFDELVSRVQALDFSERLDQSKAEEIGAAWLREFFSKIGPDTVKAPAEELITWSKVEHELYATLQRSAVVECGKMAMGQWIYIDDGNAAATAAIARRNAAMVRASAAGRDNPQVYEEPSEAAFIRLGDSIAATGIDPSLQATLGSDAAMAALSAEQQCELGVAVYKGLTDLPDDVEPQMAAYMLAPL